ncbi:nicotinamide-nucleotide amidohydrolase family protein [Hyphomicrobium sp.]|uniref:CinA family protein n=1 Tax=Hyphomicrobium sp. TaxID=82 RepID=UPI002E3661E8|nr:nicotinamide-nucleotide amidohydrolase family protein [Hyphomicrobium sp.]HEX2842998.1 nicotinamide-nucleotide amidohydrolase family protein [Hyphomicrobium sp.]
MFSDDLLDDVRRLIDVMRTRSLKLATAESCTGGLLGGLFTEIPGASDVFERGFVTYSNAAKVGDLGVDLELLMRHGAVSAEVARAMASGALRGSAADVAIAVTGVAGPGGGSQTKPVGLVHVGLAMRGKPVAHEEFRFGDRSRSAIRIETVKAALRMLHGALEV